MDNGTWDHLAAVCEANHDLYEAAHTSNPEMASEALLAGAELPRVIAWVGNDTRALRFLLNLAGDDYENHVVEILERLDRAEDVETYKVLQEWMAGPGQ